MKLGSARGINGAIDEQKLPIHIKTVKQSFMKQKIQDRMFGSNWEVQFQLQSFTFYILCCLNQHNFCGN